MAFLTGCSAAVSDRAVSDADIDIEKVSEAPEPDREDDGIAFQDFSDMTVKKGDIVLLQNENDFSMVFAINDDDAERAVAVEDVLAHTNRAWVVDLTPGEHHISIAQLPAIEAVSEFGTIVSNVSSFTLTVTE